MQPKFLTISNRHKMCNVPVAEITYIKSSGMCSTVYTAMGSWHLCSKNIGALEKELSDSDAFYRVHTSIIVSLSKIKEYKKVDGGVIIMNDDSEIIPAKRRKAGFLKAFRKNATDFK